MRWEKLALKEHDPGGTCLGCNGQYSIDEGCEPTPLCHSCAQEAVVALAENVLHLRKKLVRQAEHHRKDVADREQEWRWVYDELVDENTRMKSAYKRLAHTWSDAGPGLLERADLIDEETKALLKDAFGTL